MRFDSWAAVVKKEPWRQKNQNNNNKAAFFWTGCIRKNVCWAGRHSERLYMSRSGRGVLLQPFDERWVSAAAFHCLPHKVVSPWLLDAYLHCSPALAKSSLFLQPDVESDWSPIHDAAFNGRVLALQRLIAQVKIHIIMCDKLISHSVFSRATVQAVTSLQWGCFVLDLNQ